MKAQAPVGAGKGVLWLSGAKLYFMIAGALLQIALPTIVSRVTFGALAVVTSLVSPINNVMVTGSIQTVSRALARAPDAPMAVGAAGLRMHLYVGLPVAFAFAASAPLWSHWFGDLGKVWPLVASAVIVAAYAFYAVLVGLANGARQFQRQAALDVTFATLRVGLMLGAGALGLGLWGVLGGWIAAAVLIIGVAVWWIGWSQGTARAATSSGVDGVSPRALAKMFAGLAVVLVLSNALLFIDTWMIKRAAGAWYREELGLIQQLIAQRASWLTDVSGYSPTAASLADVQVAYYGAAQNVARLTYQAMIAVAFVVFPLISQATFRGDTQAAARYVNTALRYSALAVGAMGVGFAAVPVRLLDIPYSTDYAIMGGAALGLLAASNAALALLGVATTIANAAGFERQSSRIIGGALALIALGGVLGLSGVAPGPGLLVRAAQITFCGIAAGSAGMLWLLRRAWPGALPLATLGRVAVSAGVAVGCARWGAGYLPVSAAGTLMAASGAVATYVVLIIASGEKIGRRAPQ